MHLWPQEGLLETCWRKFTLQVMVQLASFIEAQRPWGFGNCGQSFGFRHGNSKYGNLCTEEREYIWVLKIRLSFCSQLLASFDCWTSKSQECNTGIHAVAPTGVARVQPSGIGNLVLKISLRAASEVNINTESENQKNYISNFSYRAESCSF